MSDMPDFISQENKIDYNIEAPEIKSPWASKNIYKIMLYFSIAWFLIVLLYVTKYFGWSNLFLMMPNEFGGFLAGVTLPLAAIWVIMAYIDRGTNFKNEAKFLRAYMNQLVYPEEGSAQTAKAMADAIRSQVVELQEVTKEANLQTLNIKKGLEVKIDEFSRLVGILDSYSSKTMNEFSGNVENMVKNFEYVNSASNQAAENLKGALSEFSEISHSISKDLNGLFNSITPQINELKISSQELNSLNEANLSKVEQSNQVLKDFADKTVNNINIISKGLFDQTNALQDVSQSAVNKVETLNLSLQGSVKELGKTLDAQTTFVANHIKSLEANNDALSKKMSAQGEFLDTEVKKVITRSSFVSESIDAHVANLNSIADNMVSNLDTSISIIKQSTEALEDNSKRSIDSLSNVVDTINISTTKADDNCAQISENFDAVDKKLKLKSEEWALMFKEVNQNSINVSSDLADKAQELKNVSLQAIDDIKDVGQTMDKYSKDLTQTASLVVAQNKQSEVSLAQQQKNINTSIDALEVARTEIKKQIEELSRAALVINDEAVVAINNLKSQMQETLVASENVVQKTKTINSNLKEQSQEFEKSTNNTLSTMGNFNNMLNEHYKEINKTTENLEDKTAKISKTLEDQTKLVDETSEATSKKYDNILSLFSEQTNILNSVTQKTVNYVSDVVFSLDEKAETIVALFESQKSSFFDICDKLSQNTSTIAGSIKKHTQNLEITAQKAFDKINLLDEDIAKRADIIYQASNSNIEKISGVHKHLEESADAMLQKIAGVQNKFDDASKDMSNTLQSFDASIKTIEDTSIKSSQAIISSSDVLLQSNEKISQDTKEVFEMLGSHNNTLEGFLVRINAQAQNLKDVFENQKETLTDVVNSVATQARLGESSLSQQYKILSDASIEVSQKLNDIQEKFKNNVGTITDFSGKVAYEIDTLGDKLINISQDVEKSSKSAIKNVQGVSLSLSQCEEELNKTVTSSTKKVSEIASEYEKHISNFNTQTAEASTGVIEINNLILSQSDKMIKISEDTKDLVTCFNTVLNDTSQELSNRANFAFEKVKGLGENLKSLSNQLEESGKLGSKHLETSGDKLRAQMAEIVANAERISNSILGSGETFLKQSDVLVVATDDAVIKVNKVMDKLEETSKTFAVIGDVTTSQTANFAEIVDSQIKSLTQATGKADKKITELLSAYDNTTTDTFLKDASYVIETLEMSSVDIIKLLSPENVEELWKKYYNGDNSIFTRYLAKNLNKQQITAIKDAYKDNAEFRKVVTRYLSEYESLLEKAQRNERAGILLSIITSADIGKVYYIIAKALDKLS